MTDPQFSRPPPASASPAPTPPARGPVLMTVAFGLWLMCAFGITLAYLFHEPSEDPVDAGYDAGYDGGFDAGYDGGYDAGYDAGHDAGFDAGAPRRRRPGWWGGQRW